MGYCLRIASLNDIPLGAIPPASPYPNPEDNRTRYFGDYWAHDHFKRLYDAEWVLRGYRGTP